MTFKHITTWCVGLALAGCGGGGGGGATSTAQGGANPPIVSNGKNINQVNLVDAAWMGSVGITRLDLSPRVIDALYGLHLANGSQSGTYSCGSSGTVTVSVNSSNVTFSPSNCAFTVDGSQVLLVSGSLGSTNAAPIVINQKSYWGSGTFTVTRLGLDWGRGPELHNGQITVERSAAANAAWSVFRGSLSVDRNGRTDQYANAYIAHQVADAKGNAPLVTASANLSSPRFAVALSIVATLSAYTGLNEGGLVVGASDYSSVETIPDASGTSTTYTLFEPFNNNPTYKPSLSNSDPLVIAAIQKALN